MIFIVIFIFGIYGIFLAVKTLDDKLLFSQFVIDQKYKKHITFETENEAYDAFLKVKDNMKWERKVQDWSRQTKHR